MGAAGEIWQSFCIKTSKVFQGGRIGANGKENVKRNRMKGSDKTKY